MDRLDPENEGSYIYHVFVVFVPSMGYTDENQRQLADISFDKRIMAALARVMSSYSREEIFQYGVEKTEELKLMAAQSFQTVPEENVQGRFISRRNGMTIRKRRATVVSNESTGATSLHSCSPPAEISLEGLDATISSLLGGIGEYSIGDVKLLFEQVDSDGSGYISEAELNAFLDMALASNEDKDVIDKVERGMSSKSLLSNRSTNSLLSLNEEQSRRSSMASEAQEQVSMTFGGIHAINDLKKLSLDPDFPLMDWSLFYCGGSSQMEHELKTAQKKYGLADLAVERFDW